MFIRDNVFASEATSWPPQIRAEVKYMSFPAFCKTVNIYIASSLVGAKIKAHKPSLADILLLSIYYKIGTRNARVFPEPVGAIAKTLRCYINSGIVNA